MDTWLLAADIEQHRRVTAAFRTVLPTKQELAWLCLFASTTVLQAEPLLSAMHIYNWQPTHRGEGEALIVLL